MAEQQDVVIRLTAPPQRINTLGQAIACLLVSEGPRTLSSLKSFFDRYFTELEIEDGLRAALMSNGVEYGRMGGDVYYLKRPLTPPGGTDD